MPESPQSETKSTVVIDYANNPELASLFSRKQSGDKCSFSVELTLMTKSSDGAKLSLDKIITDYGDEEEEDTEITPTNTTPVMISMKSRKKKLSADDAEEVPQSTAQPVENSLGTRSYA